MLSAKCSRRILIGQRDMTGCGPASGCTEGTSWRFTGCDGPNSRQYAALRGVAGYRRRAAHGQAPNEVGVLLGLGLRLRECRGRDIAIPAGVVEEDAGAAAEEEEDEEEDEDEE